MMAGDRRPEKSRAYWHSLFRPLTLTNERGSPERVRRAVKMSRTRGSEFLLGRNRGHEVRSHFSQASKRELIASQKGPPAQPPAPPQRAFRFPGALPQRRSRQAARGTNARRQWAEHLPGASADADRPAAGSRQGGGSPGHPSIVAEPVSRALERRIPSPAR